MGFFLLMPWVAHAAGLGKLTILSALGQPLLAEVDLVSVRAGELATLVARLAPPEGYTQANISYSPALVGVRMSIERRSGGEHYIKIISTRPVNEPFIDLLVELSWPQGRLVRDYTALLDPIGYTPPTVAAAPDAPVVSPMPVTPPVTPEPQPSEPARQPPVTAAAPVEAKPAAAKARPAKAPVAAATAAADKAYGPVKRGETLGRIASKVKPEGVTLEQMLVGLYHANPDAFGGNMNLLKTGKILRVPERQSVVEIRQSEAVREIRVEAADWNAYRAKLAEVAGRTPARESGSATSGRITTRAEDKAEGQVAAREVLKLSKGEPPAAGKPSESSDAPRTSVTNRIRMLEEEAISREKALTEANNRIAQLEKTIKDMQRVLEIKARAPVVKPAPKPLPPPPPPPSPDLIAQIMDEPAYLAAGGGVLALAGLGGYLFVRRRRTQADSDEPDGEEIEPETVKKTAASGGGALALLGRYLFARRRARAGEQEAARARIAPELGQTAAAVAAESAAGPAVTPMPVAGDTEEVDPLAEADMYLNFGRDLQAEEVLKEALKKTPGHEEAQLKLLQVYAGRKDKAAFEKIARSLYAQTQGTGDNWVKAAAMGYAFDPANTLYEAGKSLVPVETPAVGGAPTGDIDFDFDLSGAPAAGVATTDFLGSPAAEADATVTPQPPGAVAVAVDTLPLGKKEPSLNARADEIAGAQISGDAAEPIANLIEFQFETAPAPVTVEAAADSRSPALDGTSVPVEGRRRQAGYRRDQGSTFDGTSVPVKDGEAVPPTADLDLEVKVDFEPEKPPASGTSPEAAPQPATAGGDGVAMVEPDFKFDFGVSGAETAAAEAPALKLDGISLNFDEGPGAVASPADSGARDEHWHDVQTKFDLAKAYQEMDEKDGARQILREVIKEGDPGQRAEAQKLLDGLG